eukprot:372330_1
MSPKLMFIVWLWLCCILTLAQQDKDYLKMIRREPIKGIKYFITCETCKIAMKQANRRTRGMRDAMKQEQFEEEHFRNITKYMCQPYHDHGEWITTYDIVRKKNGLSLQHHDVFGRCSHECETIAEACQAIIDEFEEELPEYLYSRISTAKLQQKICKKPCRKSKKRQKKIKMQSDWGSEEFEEIADDQKGMFRSFVMGELYKREQPEDEDKKQQDYLQRYAEAYIDQTETAKKQKEEKRRYENKKRARKGLPPLPEEDEESEDAQNSDDADQSSDQQEYDEEGDAKTDL